jgi:hypothetical protein
LRKCAGITRNQYFMKKQSSSPINTATYMSFVLFLAFIYSSIGHFWLLQTTLVSWKKQVKKTIKYTTPPEKLVQFDITLPQNWLEKGVEFEYAGNHYDIIKIENGKYFCWLDEKENQLVEQIVAHFIQKSTEKNNSDFSIFKNIIKDYFFQYQYIIHLFYENVSLNRFYYSLPSTIIFKVRILKPPTLSLS